MGQLADRLRALRSEVGTQADWPRWYLDAATLADRIAELELEQWQDEQLANALTNPRDPDTGMRVYSDSGVDGPIADIVQVPHAYTQIGGVNQSVVVAILLPSSPLVADHLERHATLLIEAGEELLKRYEAERAAEKAKVPA